MEIDDFAKEYEAKTDQELLDLALDLSQLTPPARSSLTAELAKRRIDQWPSANGRENGAQRCKRDSDWNSVVLWGPKRATARDWKEYKRHTGEWPLASIFAYLLLLVVALLVVACLAVYSARHDWSKIKFLLALTPMALFYAFLSDRLLRKVKLSELQHYRRRRKADGA